MAGSYSIPFMRTVASYRTVRQTFQRLNYSRMSTQDVTGIPFSASHLQQAFKLLELPPELLTLLESDNPPVLYLKSAPSTAATAPAQAILCAPDATYRIQQKNSSNPIMIIEPCLAQTDDPESTITVPSLRTIATIEDTLELSKQESDITPVAPAKINKWHEKFAKGRTTGKG